METLAGWIHYYIRCAATCNVISSGYGVSLMAQTVVVGEARGRRSMIDDVLSFEERLNKMTSSVRESSSQTIT